MITFILVLLVSLAAGFLHGFSGFGSALLAVSILTMFIDVKIAVPLCILNMVLITAYLSLKLKDFMDKKKILPLVAGSLPGIIIGVIFFKNVEADIIKLLLGILIVIYCIYSLNYHRSPKKIHPIWAYVAGFSSGLIGSAFSAASPPAVIYTTLTGWSRDHIKAALSGFFLVSSFITVVVHSASGLIDTLVMKYFFSSAVFVFIGVYAGSSLYDRNWKQEYIKNILIVLMILGVIMGISALNNYLYQ